MPLTESPADAKVTGGTVNGTGAFIMRAERVGSDTLLGQIVSMVAEAQRSRAPIQGLADGNLFYNFKDNAVMIRGQIIEEGNQRRQA